MNMFARVIMMGCFALTTAITTLAPARVDASSIRFQENLPTQYDFVDIPKVPKGFGEGEFALEMWIKPDTTYQVGGVWRGSYDQLKNWSNVDPEPYSSDGWWLSGNWLLDGHTRPEGFLGGNTREGTLSLQFYGGGRLRFMFADAKEGMPKGMVYAVQAWPATKAPSLLDGKWHHVVALRRWREPSGATLELWIDGTLIDAKPIPKRTNMRQYWDDLAHPRDPRELGGWSIGSEVMTAWNYALTQYEDYKGQVDDMRFWGRAPDAEEIRAWSRRAKPSQVSLLADFAFSEGAGATIRDRVDPDYVLTLFRSSASSWSPEDATSASSIP
jgi:Concanavalin A-like lectin/glucanases superfamily